MADEVTLLRARALAPWAQTVTDSRGRETIEEVPAFHDEFSFDISKILGSQAWQSLGGKFLRIGGGGPSLAQIAQSAAEMARLIARVLHCNEELTTAATLAHFLGMAPGGHLGRRTLEWMMRPHGEYSVLGQALRVLEEVEVIHPDYNGLNLSWEIREALGATRPGSGRVDVQLGFAPESVCVEAQVARVGVHLGMFLAMLEHGFASSLVFSEMLEECSLWRWAETSVAKEYRRVEDRRSLPLCFKRIQDRIISEVCRDSLEKLETTAPGSADAVRKTPISFVKLPSSTLSEIQAVDEVVRTQIFYASDDARIRTKQMERYNQLFELLVHNTTLLGPHAGHRLKKQTAQRVVCDQWCMMNDHALNEMVQDLLGLDSEQYIVQSSLPIQT